CAELVVDFDFLPGTNRKPVESGKSDARSKSAILDVRSEPARHSTCTAVRLDAGAARIGGALEIETRTVDAVQRPFPGLDLGHCGFSGDSKRMLCSGSIGDLRSGRRLQQGTRLDHNAFRLGSE